LTKSGVLSYGKEQTLLEGGKRLVNWQAVCHPKPFGGLGILNLDIMNTAFSVCRAWKLRAEEEKTLVLTSLSC
jgi:hypothetical protein